MLSVKEAQKELSRRNLIDFVQWTMSDYEVNWHHEYTAQKLTDFVNGKIKRLMIFMPPQHGKLINNSEVVPTLNGMKKHGDLRAGDVVFHPSGKPIVVLAEIPQVEPASVELMFSNGQVIKCHPKHEWTVIRGRSKTVTVEADHFLNNPICKGVKGKRGSRYIYQLPNTESLDLPVRHLTIDPYTLGAWLGDGTSTKPAITCAKNKSEVISHINSIYKVSSASTHKTTGVRTFNFYRTDFWSGLHHEGLISNKHIPEDYIFSSKKQRLELLAGLIDTDGSLDKKTNRYRFVNTNKALIGDVCLLLSSLGYTYSVSKSEPRKKPNKSGVQDRKVCYQIGFNALDVVPCKIPRKQTNASKLQRKVSLISARLLPTNEHEQGKCIQVDSPDGLYLVGTKMIPTHNSELSTRRTPAFMLGKKPDTKAAIIAYNHTFASKFNRDVQRIIDSEEYKEVFKDTRLSGSVKDSQGYLRNNHEFEVVGKRGSLISVGVGGGLTGNRVDVGFIDDPFKDAKDAWSPVVRENVWEWYTTVFETRLHNDSQQLITLTRWHEDDLAGRILKKEADLWEVVSFPAIKVNDNNPDDPREVGEALWEERHSKEKLLQAKAKSEITFESLYQQDPKPMKGLLYSRFATYEKLPDVKKGVVKAYIDTADTGKDYLCSIVYLDAGMLKYVIDVVYTQDAMELTEPLVANQLTKFSVNLCKIESNNGGRAFARNVDRLLKDMGNTKTVVSWFHQSKNKESRIFSESANVQRSVVMPDGWHVKFPEYHHTMTHYSKEAKNEFDDAPDATTGLVEETNVYNW